MNDDESAYPLRNPANASRLLTSIEHELVDDQTNLARPTK
jgi:hypothetical protein